MTLLVSQKRQTSVGASTTISGALHLTQRSGASFGLVSEVIEVLIRPRTWRGVYEQTANVAKHFDDQSGRLCTPLVLDIAHLLQHADLNREPAD